MSDEFDDFDEDLESVGAGEGLTLAKLSHRSKTAFESREYQTSSNFMMEAQKRFPQEDGERLVQDVDGSIVVEYTETDKRNGQEHVKRRPVE